MTKSEKKSEPMDPSTREKLVGTASTNRQRNAYALDTLVNEVQDMFPETPAEYSNYTGRNVALDVTFDATSVGDADFDSFLDLLRAASVDERVREVLIEDGQAIVSLHANPRIQDSREPFNLSDAWLVLAEDESL